MTVGAFSLEQDAPTRLVPVVRSSENSQRMLTAQLGFQIDPGLDSELRVQVHQIVAARFTGPIKSAQFLRSKLKSRSTPLEAIWTLFRVQPGWPTFWFWVMLTSCRTATGSAKSVWAPSVWVPHLRRQRFVHAERD